MYMRIKLEGLIDRLCSVKERIARPKAAMGGRAVTRIYAWVLRD